MCGMQHFSEVRGNEFWEKAQSPAAEAPGFGLEGPETHLSGIFCVPHLCVCVCAHITLLSSLIQ